ncbi:hypothetical protein CS022_18355 [Veronia nyctiphanis]|uniref:Uncharacterized protein n=1 Tax=Veronia nyctiphanis TaxID=1278244 RepID=A0A4Q0YPP8_9GAMM|nr:hypothetical protein [Veronia nyctiphanis]RXJ71964.1 hypothetical protein CS022_18355 [Veronia nyctiphanis]
MSDNSTEFRELPVKETIAQALRLPIDNIKVLLQACSPFLFFLFALTIIGPYVFDVDLLSYTEQADFDPAVLASSVGIAVLLSLAFAVMAVVRCHQIFVYPADERPPLKIFNFSMKELGYIGWSIAMGLIVAIISIPYTLVVMIPVGLLSPDISFAIGSMSSHDAISITVGILTNVLWLPVMYLAARWSLVLPAMALGVKGTNIVWAWDISKGNGVRLLLLLGIIPMLTSFVFSLFPETNNLFVDFIELVVWLFVVVFEICILSLCFKFLYKEPEQPSEVTPQDSE